MLKWLKCLLFKHQIRVTFLCLCLSYSKYHVVMLDLMAIGYINNFLSLPYFQFTVPYRVFKDVLGNKEPRSCTDETE